MEHVDLTTPASVSAPHVVSAMCSKAARSRPALPARAAAQAGVCWLRAAFTGTGTEDRVAHVSPYQSCLAAVSPFALGAAPSANAILLHTQ